MAGKSLPFESLLSFFSRILLRRLRKSPHLHRKVSINTTQAKLRKYPSLSQRSVDQVVSKNQTLIFDMEGSLLKSSSMFPYFMLVAFEASGIFRALLLLLMYPIMCLVDEEMSLSIMVMVCFFGIKEKSFRAGRAVLPKFFLEDVGLEGFGVLMRGGKKVGVSDFPRVMVESFLKEYLEIDVVVGRELKTFYGYYLGLMQDKKKSSGLVFDEIFGTHEDRLMMGNNVIGIGSFNKPMDHHLFSHCKDIYYVSEADKRSWQYLTRDKYPKPLIFHDGRLVLKPTPLNSLAVFMWDPFGFFLAIIRGIIGVALPYRVGGPLLALLGLRLNLSRPNSMPSSTTNNNQNGQQQKKKKGVLYVCNHRTLLDPLYLSAALCTPITAITYSLSRLSEILSPIKTVRFTRDRVKDANMMEKLLSQGDLIVCPEGTTCREPYLLRFSPLFAEMSDQIVPVAMDAHVSMFYGTTAGGLKCLDPLFFLMNPHPYYTVRLLDTVAGASSPLSLSTCKNQNAEHEASKFKIANHVQEELGKALGFECTKLTRKDKYLILAGNEGIVKHQ
ncbi:hypothetical protein C5167_037151 [Papaver somniferum]|uniref:Phospholipid/glycerol acyltransferase domain-containing protein n=1 Tax=Papaver somniferum TaxID=3469 RepID=A0A4Y7I9N9_PAPSO|nr:probable glycerol-3-phosphate acyltransferase 3 [Papaver somniferum]RZC44208.1 hypothetical protein C5167_037151 [Papaver somniferum]